MKKYIIQIIVITLFIFLYLMFLIYFYIFPKKNYVSIILLMGIAIIISSFLFFVNFNQITNNDSSLEIKFLSENLIKTILMIALFLALLIPPVSNDVTIILWEKVSPLNYIRAFVFLIGSAFLPGSNIYTIFLSKSKLHEKFHIEPFLLKITLYPILSFSLIGIIVLILDQIGLTYSSFILFLFLLFVVLYFSDFIIQNRTGKKNLLNLSINIKISKSLLNILMLTIGFILMSIGIHLAMLYLIPGDSWTGIAPANDIGCPNSSPISWGRKNVYYPIFWAYIIFGLSVLTGIPLFNTNALLAPFCYLFVTSTYLLMKTILSDYEEKYAILSTFLTCLFSELFYIDANLTFGIGPGIILVNQFIYKSLSFLLFINSLALILIIAKSKKEENSNQNSLLKFENIKIVFLSAFFLILSFMIYILPLFVGISYFCLYILFSNRKKENFRLLSHFILQLIIIFIIFDLIMDFYLSSSILFIFALFLNLPFFAQVLNLIPSFFFVYTIFSLLFLLSIFNTFIYINYFSKEKNIFSNLIIKHQKIFKFFLPIFTIFLIIEIISIIAEEIVLNYKLDDKFTFFFYLDLIFLNLGFTGILGFYLSYICFKIDKKLFYILISWVFFSFSMASFLILLFWAQSSSFSLGSLNGTQILLMDLWFSRNWYYSIFPLSILASIGIINLEKKNIIFQKFKHFHYTKYRKDILRFSASFLLIFLSFTNFFIWGIRSGNYNNRISDEKVELFSWMSDNIPPESSFLIEPQPEFQIRQGIVTMVNGYYYKINDIFEKDLNETEYIEDIEDLIDYKIKYLLIHEDYLKESSEDRELFIRFYLKPNFYNETIYKSNHYRLYYAPYFE